MTTNKQQTPMAILKHWLEKLEKRFGEPVKLNQKQSGGYYIGYRYHETNPVKSDTIYIYTHGKYNFAIAFNYKHLDEPVMIFTTKDRNGVIHRLAGPATIADTKDILKTMCNSEDIFIFFTTIKSNFNDIIEQAENQYNEINEKHVALKTELDKRKTRIERRIKRSDTYKHIVKLSNQVSELMKEIGRFKELEYIMHVKERNNEDIPNLEKEYEIITKQLEQYRRKKDIYSLG